MQKFIEEIFRSCINLPNVNIHLNKNDMSSIFKTVIDPVFNSKEMDKMLYNVDKGKEDERTQIRFKTAIATFRFLTSDCKHVKVDISHMIVQLISMNCKINDVLIVIGALQENLLKWLEHNKSTDQKIWKTKSQYVADYASAILKIKELELSPNKEEIKSKKSSIIDAERMANMHYKDDEKITAAQFMQDNEIEIELIDDLSDYENEMADALYEDEGLTSNMVSTGTNILEHYSKLLNQTVDFRDLAYAIQTMVLVLNGLKLDVLDKKNRRKLKLYLENITSDLSDWKEKVFVDKDALDIHYLDASMLSSCAQVEMLINPPKEEDDEDDDFELF